MAAWNTWEKSSGSVEKSAVETSRATGRTPAVSSRDGEPGSVNRATPQTSLSLASARAIGNATRPVAPVTRIFWPSSISPPRPRHVRRIAGTFYSSGMPHTTSRRPQGRIVEATLAASLLGAAPSLLYSMRRDGVLGATQYALRGTRAIATLVLPGRPNAIVGATIHFGISAVFGQALGRFLPLRRSPLWGATGGAAMGIVGAGVIGRRFAAIRDLPLGPQLADNIAFGITFALVADRPSRRPEHPSADCPASPTPMG